MLLLLLLGCGGEDPHEEATCGSWPSLGTFDPVGKPCEVACITEPTSYQDVPCESTASPNAPVTPQCLRTFDYDGTRGCCGMNPMGGRYPVMLFFECD